MKKIIVWNLFNDGKNSIGKAISSKDYEMYNFGILDTFKETNIVDLADDINQLIDYFNKFPKPDIITASPPCMSFSKAAAMKADNQPDYIKGNATWAYDTRPDHPFFGRLFIRNPKDYENKRYDYRSQLEKAEIGHRCIENTIKLIKHYKPSTWYIENPESSLMWRYIEYNIGFNEGYKNTGWYGSYGTPYKKPTTFLSNIEIVLKKEKPEQGFESFEYASKLGIDRSEIPKGILQVIFRNLKKKVKSEW